VSTLSLPSAERPYTGGATQGALAAAVFLTFAVLFAAPTRLFYTPIPYDGDFLTFTPPNFLDLICLGLAGMLFARSGTISIRLLLVLAGALLLGGITVFTADVWVAESLYDVGLFNLRMAGGLALGWMLVRSGIPPGTLGLILVAGTLITATSTIVLLAGGGGSYDFYDELGRVGGMGLGPNEASLLFAAALNALPLLYVRRPWIAFAMSPLVAGLVGTGSRTGVLLALGGMFLWVPALRRASKLGRPAVAWLTAIMVVSLTAFMTYELLLSTLFQGLLNPIGLRLGTTSDESTLGRFEIYSQVPLALWQNPMLLLFGTGASNVAVENFLKNELAIWTMHTHDLFLQLVTAYGVIGLALSYFLVRPLFRSGRRFPDESALGIRWFGLTLVGGQLIQCGLYAEKFLLIFMMVLGMVAALSQPEQGAAP
jgi:hypothetical protein